MFARLLFIAIATVSTATSVQGVEPLAAEAGIDAISNEYFADLEAGKGSEAWQFAFKGPLIPHQPITERPVTCTLRSSDVRADVFPMTVRPVFADDVPFSHDEI